MAESLLEEISPLENRSKARVSERAGHPLLYLSFVLAASMVLLLLPIPLARTRFFIEISRRTYWHAMDYHAQMADEGCKVVIFGDSTGMTGADPLILEKRTGLKTCVLSVPYMALSTTGYRVLDNYLARSTPPLLILFVNHARHLRPPVLDQEIGIVDGWLLAARLLPTRQAARFFIANPRSTLIFLEAAWQQVFTLSPIQGLDLSRKTYREDVEMFREHNGYFPLLRSLTPSAICAEQIDDSSYDPTYLPELRLRYETKRTRIALYASPVRQCDQNLASYEHVAKLLGIRPPSVYPVALFSDTAHLNEKGVPQNSEEVADLIQKTLQTP